MEKGNPGSLQAKSKRKWFGGATEILEPPYLVEIQHNSFRWFLQHDVPPHERKSQGLQELFEEVFPIENYDGSFAIEFVEYYVGKPTHTKEEAKEKDLTYSVPVRAKIRLVNRQTGEIREEEIFLGDFPFMTEQATFIINGTERVIVNQLTRSAGVYFKSEGAIPGKETFIANVIPDRGAWLEFDLTPAGVLSVKIDNRKKVPVTILLKAFGVKDDDEIVKLFGAEEKDVELIEEEVKGKLLAESIYDEEGQVIASKNERITKEILEKLWEIGRTKIKVYEVENPIAVTLERDPTTNTDEAILDLFRRLRPNEPVRMESAKEFVNGLFFDPRRYNLGRVGRYKLNKRLGLNIPESVRILTVKDIVAIVKNLMDLKKGIGEVDDIDHLGNRRVRSVGELLQNQVRIGFLRMERIAKERMTTIPDLSSASVRELINVRPISAVLNEFFGSGQLSQFMDQTNPLASLTHRRRLSALGPGGLSRERAGFEARDVHYTHYGRICPIETPEGPNIGLVTSLATYARLNEYGFITSPKRKVVNGYVTDEIVYLSADEEDKYYVGRANTPVGEDGKLLGEEVHARHKGEIVHVPPSKIDFLDLTPKQIVGVSASLIPFLEHDDANRALMGSNMQRQAVPLIAPKAPLVGTGMEYKAAIDSGVCVVSSVDGVVRFVDATRILIETEEGKIAEYKLKKFERSNQGTLVHQRPIVSVGQKVKKGDVIADGQSCENGELALGKDILVAFLSWGGYNFEDSILISERLVKEDVYTSIHIEEYEVEARDTKLGPEEITRDIPNMGEDLLRNLDENGIVRIGAEVKAGDILVGKVTPKGETEQSPEERLMRAIFGEKAREVRDTSLKVPHGEGGKVIAVKRLSRQKGDELPPGVNEVVKVYVAQMRKITVGDKMAGRHGNKGVVSKILPLEDMPYLPDGTPVDIVLNPLGVPSRMNLGQVLETVMGWVAYHNGWKVATPVFEGAKENDIFKLVREFAEKNKGKYPDLTEDGKMTIYDGRTGEPFDSKVTVGYMHMMKLIHLVDDKIHARATGPYSLITQQPLGGKAQFGGQRFGEMEVWALEGYGAAYTLQEMLTIKSDDIEGRTKTYEKIIKGQNIGEYGVPESFKVLVKELQGLGFDVEIFYREEEEEKPKESPLPPVEKEEDIQKESIEEKSTEKDIFVEVSSGVKDTASKADINSIFDDGINEE